MGLFSFLDGGIGQLVGGVLGGALGGSSKGASSSQSTQAQIDPRVANYVFGDGANGNTGLLGAASKLYQDQSAQGGLNDLQRAGMEQQRQTLINPAYTQGAQASQSLGLGLLNAGVAANPFSTGQMSLGGQSAQGLMDSGRGLLGGQQQGGLLGQTIRPTQQTYQPMSYDQNATLQAASMPIQRPSMPVSQPAAAVPAAATDPYAFLLDGTAQGEALYKKYKDGYVSTQDWG